MKYTIVGKNIEVTEPIKEKVINRIGQIERYLNEAGSLECRVVVRVYPNGQKVEVTIPTKHMILRAEVVDRDLYTAIDLVTAKLENQLRKMKARLSRKNKEKLGKAFAMNLIEKDEDNQKDELVKTKSLTVDPIDLDEAVMKMEMLGHSFFIYRDIENLKISVLYRRLDGTLGLIEVDN